MKLPFRYRILTSSVCVSLGAPISINRIRYGLTAGHCDTGSSSPFSNNRIALGTINVNAYKVDSARYGDWMLLNAASGTTFGTSVYIGALADSTSWPIQGGNYIGMANGSHICTSGRTTGTICGYIVIGSYRIETLHGITTSQMLELHMGSKDFGTGGGFQGGDSGGSCYYNKATGQPMIITGIIQGGIDWGILSNGLSYYCTQLSGVRVSFPGAVVG
jgi:streptogrisin C